MARKTHFERRQTAIDKCGSVIHSHLLPLILQATEMGSKMNRQDTQRLSMGKMETINVP
jgi:hypothetical protein